MKVSKIITDALATLNDPQGLRWPVADLLGHLVHGVNLIIGVHPGQHTIVGDVTAAAGARQTLPPEGIAVVDVVDTGSGKAPTQADLSALNQHDPAWKSATPAPATEWALDSTDARVFWLNPPQSGGETLSVKYVRGVTSLSPTQDLPVDDRFAAPLHDFLVGMAKGKDSNVAADESMATMYRNRFMEAISGQSG